MALARYLAGEMSTREELAFRKKLEADPGQKKALNMMEKTWSRFDSGESFEPGDSSKAWEKLHQRLKDDGLLDHPPFEERSAWRPYALRIAAVIVLILAVGIPAVYFGLLHDPRGNTEQRHTAQQGINAVDLPDGSRVFLNQGASLTYPARFDRERSVTLSGEAFFEVMSDPQNPFTVDSGKVTVTVLGTAFNIKPSAQDEEMEVYVESGRVRMSLEETGRSITLGPGQLGASSRQELTSGSLKDPNYLSWKTKEFKFVEADLLEVLRELADSYHVRIHTGDLAPNQMKITTSYSEQSIDAILETIGAAFGVTVTHGEDGYHLSN